ncbi:TPA: hypothetical protein DCZ36_00200 [Candidatus Gracilibacteria bacterium]|nr:hypothetical protein [Candidatus Gracilibacteria bacterium]
MMNISLFFPHLKLPGRKEIIIFNVFSHTEYKKLGKNQIEIVFFLLFIENNMNTRNEIIKK